MGQGQCQEVSTYDEGGLCACARDSVFRQISEVFTTHQARLAAARGTRVSSSPQELVVVL